MKQPTDRRKRAWLEVEFALTLAAVLIGYVQMGRFAWSLVAG